MLSNIHKYEPGEIVYEIGRPQQLMSIIKRNGLIYHCHLNEHKNSFALVFMERDLKRVAHQVGLPKLANIA